MNKQIEQVHKFHQKFNVPIGVWSSIPPNKRIELRMRLFEEEGWEVRKALQDCKFNTTLAKSELMGALAKEICDVIYVAHGTLIEFGLHNSFEHAFDLVHNSNMTKMIDNARDDGKILKGPNYVKPDMEKLFV